MSSTYSSTPSAYTSVAVVTAPPASCSGAAYAGVSAEPASCVSVAGMGPRTVQGRLALQQLGDAEIEQLYVAIDADEHVARLDVAVHDEIGMSMGDGCQHVEKEPQARLGAEPAIVTVAIDALAIDVLEHEVGLAGRRHAGIDQVRDVRMPHARQDRTFAPEPLFAGSADDGGIQQLDCGQSFEPAVAALRQPDAAHAALADQRYELVGAENLPDQRRRRRGDWIRTELNRALEKAGLVNGLLLRKEHLQVGRKGRDPLPR